HDRLPHIVSCHSPRLIKVGNLSRTFRFVHVDGSHLYSVVKQDIRTAKRLLRKDGVVIFDDYRSEHTPGVGAAVWEEVVRDGLIPICLTPQKLYGTWDASHHSLVNQLAKWAKRLKIFEVSQERVYGRTLVTLKGRTSSV